MGDRDICDGRTHQKSLVREYYQSESKLTNLDVPNLYHRDDPELIGLLKSRLAQFVDSG